MTEMPKDLSLLNGETAKEFWNSFDTIFCDCDGVLWVGNTPIENSNKVLNRLRELGKNLIFITNNSSKSRDEFLVKFQTMGIVARRDEILNTAYLAAEYLNQLNFTKKVYVIGYPGLARELDEFGIRHTEAGPDIMDTDLLTYIKSKMKLDPDVGAVVVGFDEHFSFPKMIRAVNYLSDPDCLFIATECDETFIIDGIILPLGVCSVKALETATKRNAYFIGKPSQHIVDTVMKKFPADPARTLMIGDNCTTDILFGKKCGFRTLLVLSGKTTPGEMAELSRGGELAPDYFINKLGDLLEHL